tara:strand:+ start:6659 stop:9535 length:2877 start_codon:yes stop_codon:yes gene_type:complete
MPQYGKLKIDEFLYNNSGTDVTLVLNNIALKANPTFTGTVTVPTATAGDNSTKAASTAFVVASFAPKVSPTFSGTVTVPTASADDNTTKAASTAYVQTELGDYLTTATATSTYAPKANPAFTGSATGVNLTLSGDLTVNGTTTTINTTTLQVEDKNIEIGKVSSPSDTTADGGGWTLLGATNKTFNWVNATDAWTSSEHIHLIDNKKLFVGGASGTTDGLEIVHNGSNSILNDSGTGTLQLQLGGSTKLEIQSGGINVTGAIQVNGSALSTAPQITATASGAITAGNAVIVNANGTVSKATLNVTANNESQITATLSGTPRSTSSEMTGAWDEFMWGYDTQYSVLLCGTSSVGGSNDYKFRMASWTGSGDGTFPVLTSPKFTVPSGQRLWDIGPIVEDPNQNKHIIFYSTNNDYSNPYCKGAVITVTSATAASVGSAVNFSASGDYFSPWGCFDSNVDKFITTYTTSSGALKVRACYIDGTSITNHSEITVQDGTGRTSSDKARLVFDSTNNKTVCIYSVGATLKAKVITCASNGTVTAGSEVAITSSGDFPHADFSTKDGKIAVVYRKPSNGYRVICGTVSGTSISFGSEFDFAGLSTNDISVKVKYSAGSEKFIVLFRDNNTKLQGEVLNLSGTTFSEHADIISDEGAAWGLAGDQAIRYGDRNSFTFIYDPTKGRVAYLYSDNGSNGPYYTHSFVDGVSATNLTTENYIGVAAASASDTATATIDVSGATNANQSSLTPGQKYYVQGNGSLGLTKGTPSVFAGTAVAATKLIVNDQQPIPVSVWEVVATHDLSDGAQTINNTGWSDSYQMYKLVITGLSGLTSQVYLRYYFDASASSTGTGTLATSDHYDYKRFAWSGQMGSATGQYYHKLYNNSSSANWYSVELNFPMHSAGSTSTPKGCYGTMYFGGFSVFNEVGGYSHSATNSHFLKGVQVYFPGGVTNMVGRLTFLRQKYA